MKFIKRLLLFIVGVIFLLLIVALFVKKDFSVSKEVVINKPVAQVYEYLRYLKHQDNFSVWNKADTAMSKSYSGTDGQPGFIYSWNSKKVGVGAQEIKGIQENKRIDFELRFEEPIKTTNFAYFTTKPIDGDKTKVVWVFYGTNQYPFNIMNLFMGNMIGKDFEQGLTNLKQIMEQ